jgi:c(7)-type cytochrome triheme protein
MINKTIYISIVLLFLSIQAGYAVWFNLPPLPPPELYGNILINRGAKDAGVETVTFSHWMHRIDYTCRVCHYELEFNMMLNTTRITEEDNRNGRYCGACHDGKIAFGHTKKNCDKCHNGDIGYGREKFKTLSGLPTGLKGNGIDWVQAFKQGLIKPKSFLNEETKKITFEREVIIESPWRMVSPVRFPHVIHGEWLDCSNCHPEIFNIKRDTTENFEMENILNYELCGACHGKVAFPPNNNCKRCHPKIKHPGKSK